MIRHHELDDKTIRSLIKNKKILYAGNRSLKIYGTLACWSGKRMKQENRVFFASRDDAVLADYRPCGHCMKMAYKKVI